MWRSLLVAGLLLLLGVGYVWTGQPVTVVINGQSHQVRTHRLSVEGVLQEIGLALATGDIVRPPPGTRLEPHQTVTIQLAQPVVLEADGRIFQQLTQQRTVAGLLADAGIAVNPYDDILLEGRVGTMQSAVQRSPNPDPAVQEAATFRLMEQVPRGAVAAARPRPVHLVVHRAVPVTVYDGGVRSTFYTTRPNVGEALLEQGLTLFLGDKVMPSLGSRLSPGMRIFIQRSIPVAVTVDGRTVRTRTRRETVGQVLAQEGIALMGQDFTRPALNRPLSANETIEVVRVREIFEIEQEFIPFETNWVPDADMEIDRQEVRQPGTTGVIKSRTRVRYENGQEMWREVEDEWLDQEASNRIIAYGTNITVRTVDTPDGPLQYWRKVSMLVTPYSAATSGKDPSHPRYGITRSGLPARYGIVAVDPKVIPLMTELYIPGYGRGLAGDTGGLILGKHIDLGYDEDQPLPNLYEWRDIYVLTPVPPADKIRYVLPQWPQR